MPRMPPGPPKSPLQAPIFNDFGTDFVSFLKIFCYFCVFVFWCAHAFSRLSVRLRACFFVRLRREEDRKEENRKEEKNRKEKRRHDKIRQDKTRQDKTRQDMNRKERRIEAG